MKKLLIIFLSLGLAFGASAQKIGGGFRGGAGGGFHGGGGQIVRPRVTVVAPYAPMYYGYGMGMGLGLGLGYSPFYDPYYRRPYNVRPSELELQIEDIKHDYDYQISTVKHDKSIPKDERKQQVRDLKHQRENAINDAQKNYYYKSHNKQAQDNKVQDDKVQDNS